MDVQLNYLDRQYVVTMSVYQLSMLLEFAHCDEVSVQKLITECSLPLSVVIKILKGLLDAGILKCANGSVSVI